MHSTKRIRQNILRRLRHRTGFSCGPPTILREVGHAEGRIRAESWVNHREILAEIVYESCEIVQPSAKDGRTYRPSRSLGLRGVSGLKFRIVLMLKSYFGELLSPDGPEVFEGYDVVGADGRVEFVFVDFGEALFNPVLSVNVQFHVVLQFFGGPYRLLPA